MNRRQLAQAVLAGAPVPLFGIAALPEAMADTTKEAPATTDSEDDKFHAAIVFDRGVPDFIVRGIYTHHADAEAHVLRMKAAGHQAWNILANRSWLREHFIGERLGELKAVLERVEARFADQDAAHSVLAAGGAI